MGEQEQVEAMHGELEDVEVVDEGVCWAALLWRGVTGRSSL